MVTNYLWLKRYLKINKISYSRGVFPKTRGDRLKYFFWRAYEPLHPYIRDGLIACKLIRHSGRQPFLLGYISKQISTESFIKKAEMIGYHRHLLAWKDDDEIVSLRLSDDFAYQYHLRVFADGEVRGHYEYTPEAYPIAHLVRVHFFDTRDFFLQQFSGYVDPAYENLKEERPFLAYTRAFICFFYRNKREPTKK